MKYYCRLYVDSNDTIGVEFPDISGVNTFGDNIQHALKMGKEALEGILKCGLDRGRDIPLPIDRSNTEYRSIEVDPAIAKRILESKIASLQKELEELEPKKTQKSKKEPALV